MARTIPSESTPVVEARGQATVHIAADEARLTLRATGRHQLAATAYRRRETAVDIVRAVVEAAGDTVRTQGERLDESSSYSDQVQASWQVQLVAPVEASEELREIIARLAAVEDVEVTGPQWSLSGSARAEARQRVLTEAVTAAREDASTLATALGGKLGPLLYVSNQDSGGARPMERAVMMAASSSAEYSLPDRTLELDLIPEDVEVSAAVVVEYRFDGPNV